MITQWKFASLAAATTLAACVMALAWPHAASANPFFQKQTGLPCSSCHNSGQENQGEQGLNAVGRAFKSCGFKLGCDSPAPTPPPRPKTTEFFDGLATFHGSCPGQQRWVTIRVRKNEVERAMGLVIDPGQNVTIAVPIGTVWASGCGTSAGLDPSSFHFITLTTVVP
jgi:hypothetical protein